ncbi:MAG: Gfo/Idh/MocA family oxidoreductase [Myxococcales bacterium]|nr:Gfo/Idh/MocA family oxidoreductase [Myxococcales bacterium]
MKNFALIGVGGYVAPRHLKAIRDTNNTLVASVDLHDSVGRLDSVFPDSRFFTEIERFDRHLEKLRRRSDLERVHYVSVCSPNYLHDAHARLALRVKAHAICEKPLVISPWNLDQLLELEAEHGARVYNVLQLRMHPSLIALRERLTSSDRRGKADVVLTYCTRRGPWYHVSWKGQVEKSGGVAMNIGIHFFDLLIWLFGEVEHTEVHLRDSARMAGRIELEHARVRWFLSVDGNDLPEGYLERGQAAFRSITIDGVVFECSGGFTDLHTRVYEDILSGGGFGIEDARPSIALVHEVRSQDPTSSDEKHPLLSE